MAFLYLLLCWLLALIKLVHGQLPIAIIQEQAVSADVFTPLLGDISFAVQLAIDARNATNVSSSMNITVVIDSYKLSASDAILLAQYVGVSPFFFSYIPSMYLPIYQSISVYLFSLTVCVSNNIIITVFGPNSVQSHFNQQLCQATL